MNNPKRPNHPSETFPRRVRAKVEDSWGPKIDRAIEYAIDKVREKLDRKFASDQYWDSSADDDDEDSDASGPIGVNVQRARECEREDEKKDVAEFVRALRNFDRMTDGFHVECSTGKYGE